MTVKAQIAQMIDFIPDSDLPIIFEVVKRFLPDDYATAEDITGHRAAMQEYERGETVPHDAINWN